MAKNTKDQKALDKSHDLIDVELYKVFKKIKSNKHFKKLGFDTGYILNCFVRFSLYELKDNGFCIHRIRDITKNVVKDIATIQKQSATKVLKQLH